MQVDKGVGSMTLYMLQQQKCVHFATFKCILNRQLSFQYLRMSSTITGNGAILICMFAEWMNHMFEQMEGLRETDQEYSQQTQDEEEPFA